jgi:hypothetical protein
VNFRHVMLAEPFASEKRAQSIGTGNSTANGVVQNNAGPSLGRDADCSVLR